MSARCSRIALAVLPTLEIADRLVERLQADGHGLRGGLLLGGAVDAISPRRVLLTSLDGTPLWAIDDAPPGRVPTASPPITDRDAHRQAEASAHRRLERLARELPDTWREVHDDHLGGHAVLGVLPAPLYGEHETRLGRTVLDHAHGFFGLFDLHEPPDR